MPQQETKPLTTKVVDSYTNPWNRETHRMGKPVMEPPPPPRTRMTRRELLKKVFPYAAAAGVVGVSEVATNGGISSLISRLLSNIKVQNTSFENPEHLKTAAVTPTETPIDPIDREIVKIQRGITTINKFDVQNGDQVRFRRDADTAVSIGNQPTPSENRILWDSIKSINGVNLGAAILFSITDAPIVKGQSVDEAGQGYWWIKLQNVELKDGEKTILYVSRSKKTENIVQVTSGTPQDPIKEPNGKIQEPNMGRINIGVTTK